MKKQSLSEKYRHEHTAPPMFNLELISRLLSYLKPHAFLAFTSLVILIIARAIDAFVPVYIGYLVQSILQGTSQTLANKQQLFSIALREATVVGALLLASYLLDMAGMVVKNWIGQKALFTLRTEVYNHIQHLPISYFDRHPTGRLITRTIHDVEQINQMFIESVIPLLGSILLFVGMSIGIAFVNWHIALVFAMITPLVVWLTYRFQHYQHYCYNMIRNIVSAMNTFIQEYLSGTSTVRTFGLQEREKKRFDELNRDNCDANMEATHHFSYFVAGIDLLQSISLIAAFVVLVMVTPPHSSFQAGTYFTFSLYTLMFFRPLIDLADRYNILQSAMSAAERIFAVLDEPQELMNSKELSLQEVDSIKFEDVWFAYDAQNWILKGVSFEIAKGESVAFVGMTGAGKSTIISLLMRFYDFQKGDIKINGRSIKDYPLHGLRQQFSVVLQDPVIFSGTVEENISLYSPEITLEKVDKVIDHLNLRSFIDRLPHGLQQVLSEHGESISMGERQLISLARAVAHRRSVMVLDEATANIDSTTEKVIQRALQKILKSQTSLVVAHRLSTIQDVNRIIVLHESQIVEIGSHAELLGKKGLYEKLYKLQFSNNYASS